MMDFSYKSFCSLKYWLYICHMEMRQLVDSIADSLNSIEGHESEVRYCLELLDKLTSKVDDIEDANNNFKGIIDDLKGSNSMVSLAGDLEDIYDVIRPIVY